MAESATLVCDESYCNSSHRIASCILLKMADSENKSGVAIQKLIDQVKAYRPTLIDAYATEEKNSHPRRLVISMFGNVGVGKSSLINSFLSIFHPDGNVAQADIAPRQYQRGKTLCRNCYNLTNYVCLVDNRGMVNLDSKEAIKEVISQIGELRW